MRTFPILGLLFLAAMAFVPGKSFAQTQNHELGIRFSGLTDLNVIYKRQKAPKTFHRFRIATTTLAYARTTNPDNQDIFNLNLENMSHPEFWYYSVFLELVFVDWLGCEASNYQS
jgi:hypothetical protein